MRALALRPPPLLLDPPPQGADVLPDAPEGVPPLRHAAALALESLRQRIISNQALSRAHTGLEPTEGWHCYPVKARVM